MICSMRKQKKIKLLPFALHQLENYFPPFYSSKVNFPLGAAKDLKVTKKLAIHCALEGFPESKMKMRLFSHKTSVSGGQDSNCLNLQFHCALR